MRKVFKMLALMVVVISIMTCSQYVLHNSTYPAKLNLNNPYKKIYINFYR